jgi:hypothetical protein
MKYLLILFALVACSPHRKAMIIKIPRQLTLTGNAFYKEVISGSWKERDSLALLEILHGDIPDFLKKFVRINTQIATEDGKVIKAHYYVMPDYISIGTNNDFARIPLTPIAAQQIADSFHCFLPTRKIVNDVYEQAKVKLEPVPMYAFRDSSITMWQHHLIIEGQRKQQKGLIAGIKKDVVITEKLTRDTKPDRVAIYGWHKLDGKAIQRLYTGHVNWYVDYSHGVRLVYRTIWVGKKRMDYIDVMKNPKLRKLLCDEEFCDVYHY